MRRIFDKLAAIARACGPVRIYPQKTRAIMQVRIRFAGCRPMKHQLVAHFLLPRGTTSARFSDTLTNASPHYIAAYVPLRSEAEVDAEIKRWMKRAYRFGCQEHLR